ncbi:hypothetical protein DFP72DRAFT_855377 [Ephemerocybe angulata]|uniref:Uncharacterized protein n=1 Tax=Ephemerocybe angulata TaxID=980116 RepID=A0A8H6LZR4_9AGAR|nr:hypothetical protein DFP72DRAFT_855377 [Tulosesus angulatus]
MRLLLPTLLTVAISLVSIVNAHQDHTLDAREYVDELTAREEAYNALERRELFSDISTRELIDEVSDRLERRGLAVGGGCAIGASLDSLTRYLKPFIARENCALTEIDTRQMEKTQNVTAAILARAASIG